MPLLTPKVRLVEGCSQGSERVIGTDGCLTTDPHKWGWFVLGVQ
jgi:hypothetical protein